MRGAFGTMPLTRGYLRKGSSHGRQNITRIFIKINTFILDKNVPEILSNLEPPQATVKNGTAIIEGEDGKELGNIQCRPPRTA